MSQTAHNKRQDGGEKPEWKELKVFLDEDTKTAVIIKKLAIKKPVLSFRIVSQIDERFVIDHRPRVTIDEDGQATSASIADAVARLTIEAESFCRDFIAADNAAFRASQQRKTDDDGPRPNRDPKELAKRKRREQNLARRRDEDRARAHR